MVVWSQEDPSGASQRESTNVEEGDAVLFTWHSSITPLEPVACSELDREKVALERQEVKTLADIKKAAKAGQVESAKIMAKDVVRTRRYIKKMVMMKTQIQAVSLKIQVAAALAVPVVVRWMLLSSQWRCL